MRMIPLGGGVVHVLLSRPDKLNSLDLPMFESIAEAAHILRTDPSWNGNNLRAVVMSGEGRAFCTGLDAGGVALSGPPGGSLRRLLERPSPYGGEGALGNLAQDVCYLWRRVCVIIVGRSVGRSSSRSLLGFWTFFVVFLLRNRLTEYINTPTRPRPLVEKLGGCPCP